MIAVEKILQDRTMVSLTLMLVIATISASIQQVGGDVQLFLERLINHHVSLTFSLQSLPATPYFKMIDIWLFFTMNLMVVSDLEKTRSQNNLNSGSLPHLPHLLGVCHPNCGAERKEVPTRQDYFRPNFDNIRI